MADGDGADWCAWVHFYMEGFTVLTSNDLQCGIEACMAIGGCVPY